MVDPIIVLTEEIIDKMAEEAAIGR